MNRQRVPAWLALGLPASAVLFNVAWLVLGFISPGFSIWGAEIAPYSPISAGISGLGLGLTAPYMNAAFIVSGLLVFVGVAGAVWNIAELSARDRWLCFSLLGVLLAVGLVTDGVFSLESMMFHLAGFAVGVGGSVPGFLVVGVILRRIPGWRGLGNGLIAAAPLTLVLMVLYVVTFSPTAAGAEHGISGLVERGLVVELFVWLAAVGWTAFRWRSAETSTRSRASRRPPTISTSSRSRTRV